MRESSKPQTYEDRVLVCVDCGDQFVWTAGEQLYFSERGLAPVKRCPRCREFRRRTVHGPRTELDSAIAPVRQPCGDYDRQGAP